MRCKISTVFVAQQFPGYIFTNWHHKTEVFNTGKLFTNPKHKTEIHEIPSIYLSLLARAQIEHTLPLLNSSLDDSVVEAMLLLARRFFKVVDTVISFVL